MPAVQSVRPSDEELAAGRLSPVSLQRAVEILYEDGIVMIENVIDHRHLDILNERMTKDASTLWNSGFRKGPEATGNIQLDPPSEPDLVFEDVFFNKFALAVASAYLGGRPRLTFSSGNAALHGTISQDLHSDFHELGKVPTVPFAVVANEGLTDMNPDNGSTEVWLGTHRIPRNTVEDDLKVVNPDTHRIRLDAQEQRKKEYPNKGPFQPIVPKGAILLRDLRLWHCGRPNPTQVPRIMLAQILFAPWYKNPMRLEFPKGMEGYLDRPEVEIPADFVDGPVDHLKRTTEHTYDFGQVV